MGIKEISEKIEDNINWEILIRSPEKENEYYIYISELLGEIQDIFPDYNIDGDKIFLGINP